MEVQTHYRVLFGRDQMFRTAFQKLGGLQAITKAPIWPSQHLPPPPLPAFEREIVKVHYVQWNPVN